MGVTGSLRAVGFIIQLLLTSGSAGRWLLLCRGTMDTHPVLIPSHHGAWWGCSIWCASQQGLSSGAPNTGLDIRYPTLPQGAPVQNACLLMALEVSGTCLC